MKQTKDLGLTIQISGSPEVLKYLSGLQITVSYETETKKQQHEVPEDKLDLLCEEDRAWLAGWE